MIAADALIKYFSEDRLFIFTPCDCDNDGRINDDHVGNPPRHTQ